MAFGRRGSFTRKAPDVRLRRQLDPAVSAIKETAFEDAVARRGADLSEVTEDELYELRKQARLSARNTVYGGVKDIEWSYDRETGRFRRRFHITALIALGFALGSLLLNYGCDMLVR